MLRKVKNISDEVNELHPLLDVLFKNVNNIQSVEYTHGNREFGADFVLTRIDNIIGDVNYIGIIAKKDAITQTTISSEITRQIEECSIKRLIKGGKKEIVLSEIWVVTSKNITANARTKIHHTYQASKIQFLDADKLCELINKYIPNYWYDINISESDILNQIGRHNAELDKSMSLIHTDDKCFYIEQEIVEVYASEYKSKIKKHDKIDIYKEVETNKYVIIEGGMGAGKSKLLRHIVDYYTQLDKYLEIEVIPIYTSYIDFYDTYKASLDILLKNKLASYSHPELHDKKFLFLIDGFDERREDAEKRHLQLDQLHEAVIGNNNWSLVMTTRSLNGMVTDDTRVNFCKRLELSPLTLNNTIKYLKFLCKSINITSRIIEDLKRSPLMKELPRSPISAILLAELLNDNSVDLPSNLTELYSKYLELTLGRWDLDKGLETQKEYQVSERIMMNIAVNYIDHNRSYMTSQEILEFFKDYISPRSFKFTAEELFAKIMDRSSIYRKDIDTNNVQFTHRTFAEYYYAKAQKENGELQINNRIYDVYWMNIYYFYIGLHADCPDLLRDIVRVLPSTEPERWMMIVNLSNYFLAGSASPYSVIENNLHIPIVEAAKIYTEIIEGTIKNSPFSMLSEISLLWWVQYLLRASYSYEFFKDALEGVIVGIDDMELSTDIKLYAHFFTALICLEMGEASALEYFMNTYRNKLPTNLRIAMYHEGTSLKSPSRQFKRQVKNLRKILSLMPKTTREKKYKEAISKRQLL